jgi:5-methylcytosine-specific restriction endonuclease McrA
LPRQRLSDAERKERERLKNKAYYAAHKAKENARCARYRKENPELVSAIKKRWNDANSEKLTAERKANRALRREEMLAKEKVRRESGVYKEYLAAWRARNADRERIRQAKWARENPDRMRAKVAKRRAAKLMATPKWVDLGEISKIYEQCGILIRSAGTKYEVDHIVPLKGENVCGLHVPWNLRIIAQKMNRAKNNRLDVAS